MPATILNKGRGMASLRYHAQRRFGQHIHLEDLTKEQLAQVEADQIAAMRIVQRKGLRASLLNKVARLRAEADALEQKVATELEAEPQT